LLRVTFCLAALTSNVRAQTQITVHAARAKPFGVGRVQVNGPAGTLRWRPDELLQIYERSRRTFYPAFVFSPAGDGSPTGDGAERLTAYFLFQGEGPLEVTLALPNESWSPAEVIRVIDDPQLHKQLQHEWWAAYTSDQPGLRGTHRLLRDYLVEMLARRLDLPVTAAFFQRHEASKTADLKKQFEHAVGMLFGIDSVLLAMQDETMLHDFPNEESATRPLPTPVRMRSPALPPSPRYVPVESISFNVPQECFYVRCVNLANHRWLRDFLCRWGGSLREIVTTSSLDYQIRERLETQLGLGLTASEQLSLEQAISDVALIGCDTLFRDGAAIGVILEAKDTMQVAAVVERQREKTRRAHATARRQTVSVDGQVVSLVSTPDNRLRSFYAVQGKYHLVSNSYYIVARFLACRAERTSLGELSEFRYARGKVTPQGGQAAFIYLSDPFFRQLVSPHYRIEMTRRRRAADDLRQLEMARIVARSEGRPVGDVADLAAEGFLPDRFDRRADGGRAILDRDTVRDSLRGRLGCFVPVMDVQLAAATVREVSAYRSFAQKYLQEWRAVDPVIVSIESRNSAARDYETVNIEILMTPYARTRYAVLGRHLASASATRLTPPRDELLGLDALLRDAGGRSYHVRLGLLDDPVPFRIAQGVVEPLGGFEHSTLAARNTYALFTPPGDEGIALLNEFARTVSSQELGVPSRRFTATRTMHRASGTDLLGWLGYAILDGITGALLDTAYNRVVQHEDRWTVIGRRTEIRQRAVSEMTLAGANSTAQVRLRMADANHAAAAPYMQAYTYMQTRRASAANVQLIHFAAQQIPGEMAAARETVEKMLGAHLVCPLGGNYRLAEGPGGRQLWTGTAWPRASYYDETRCPSEYHFAFLDWLRGLDAELSLSGDTLTAKIELRVNNRSAAK
jgi:hypothetical protein